MKRFPSITALWGIRDFRRLCASQVLAGLGEWLATMALIALVWERTHSALVSGLVLAFRIAPAAVLGSFLGTFVDRFERRRVLIASTAGRAVVYGVLPLVGGVGAVLALALVAEVGALTYMTARDAVLPRLVPSEKLPAANAMSMASAFASMPVGSGLFALFALAGRAMVPLALLTASGIFLAATLIVGTVATHTAALARPSAPDGEKASWRAGLRALRLVLRSDPILRRVALGGVIAATGGGAVITLGQAYVRGTLGAGPGAYSGLLVTFCAGALVGVASTQKFGAHLHKVFHGGIAAMGGILVVMALLPSAAVGFGMSFVFGGAFVATFLGGVTILQQRVHDSLRGRAFAFAHSGLRAGAVGMGLLAAWGSRMLGDGTYSLGIIHLDGIQLILGLAGAFLFLASSTLLRGSAVRA